MMYRFYTLDRDGRIHSPPVERDCADDDAARKHGRKILDGHDIEVWQQDRLVVRLSHRRK